MGTKFNKHLNIFFASTDGAYSEVTVRESEVDCQITATGHEKVILKEIFPDILRGSVKKIEETGQDPGKNFSIYPSGKEISLNVVYPKKKGNELRIYLKSDRFRPDPILVWFVFVRDNAPWLGAMDPYSFSNIRDGKVAAGLRPALLDINDSLFQEVIKLAPDTPGYQALITRIRRDPAISRRALQNSKYVCELCPEIPTFISKSDGNPYMEAHHIIPISLQPQIEYDLDVKENISILNPWSHRLLHHGLFSDVLPKLRKLIGPREDFYRNIGVTENDIFDMYRGV